MAYTHNVYKRFNITIMISLSLCRHLSNKNTNWYMYNTNRSYEAYHVLVIMMNHVAINIVIS